MPGAVSPDWTLPCCSIAPPWHVADSEPPLAPGCPRWVCSGPQRALLQPHRLVRQALCGHDRRADGRARRAHRRIRCGAGLLVGAHRNAWVCCHTLSMTVRCICLSSSHSDTLCLLPTLPTCSGRAEGRPDHCSALQRAAAAVWAARCPGGCGAGLPQPAGEDGQGACNLNMGVVEG